MTIKRRDFQKAVNFIQDFLLRLTEDQESAELRDSLNLALLHMQKYYKILKSRTQDQLNNSANLGSSIARGLSPITPFRDAPDRFQWKWVNLENPSVATLTKSLPSDSWGVLLPILQATKHGDMETINRIVEQDGLDTLNDVDGLGRSCVMYAIHYDHINILEFLLKSNCDPNWTAHDGSTAAHRACHDNHGLALQKLIEAGADVSIKDSQGRTPLHWAASINESHTINLLLHHQVSLTERDNEGLSPIMWACRMDCLNNLQLLRSRGGHSSMHEDTVERDEGGKTWIHWAIRRTPPLNCLQSLLNEHTSLFKDYEGKLPIHTAAEQGALSACKFIIDTCGREHVSVLDSKERSPLHLATMSGHGEVVNYLCEKGANIDTVDCQNASAWDYAVGRQLHYCTLILQYYRQLGESGEGEEGDKPPFISPRPPSFPRSRASTAYSNFTPRSSRRYVSRPSTKRSSVAASINGSVSPPPDDTFRSTQSSLHFNSGYIYPQKKREKMDYTYSNTVENKSVSMSRSPHVGKEMDGGGNAGMEDGVGAMVVEGHASGTHLIYANKVGQGAQLSLGISQQRHTLPTAPSLPEGQHALQAPMPIQPAAITMDVANDNEDAASDITDVSIPVNVSDMDEDPATVIHEPPASQVVHTQPLNLEIDSSPTHSAQQRKAMLLSMNPKVFNPNPPQMTIPAQLDQAAALKEQQLAEIQFTPLHRRASPGGHLEPLPSGGTGVVGGAATTSEEGRGHRKKKGRENKGLAMPRGRLEPIEHLQGSAYPLHQSASKTRSGVTSPLGAISPPGLGQSGVRRSRSPGKQAALMSPSESIDVTENSEASVSYPSSPSKKVLAPSMGLQKQQVLTTDSTESFPRQAQPAGGLPVPAPRRTGGAGFQMTSGSNALSVRQSSGFAHNRGRSYPGQLSTPPSRHPLPDQASNLHPSSHKKSTGATPQSPIPRAPSLHPKMKTRPY